MTCPRCSGYMTRDRMIPLVMLCTACSRRFDQRTLRPFGAQHAVQEPTNGRAKPRGNKAKPREYYRNAGTPVMWNTGGQTDWSKV